MTLRVLVATFGALAVTLIAGCGGISWPHSADVASIGAGPVTEIEAAE